MQMQEEKTQIIFNKDSLSVYELLGWRKSWYRAAAGLLASAAPTSNARALDLCCGTGDLAFCLRESDRFSVVLGLDFDEELLETAKIRSIASERRGQTAPIFAAVPMRKLPVEDEEVDVVGSAFGPGTDEERMNALFEAYRVMRQGATICILDYCCPESWMRRLLCRLQFIFDALLQRDAVRGAWKSCYEARLHAPTVHERRDDLLKAGFDDVQTHRFVFGDAVLIWAKKSCGKNSAPSEA